MKFPVIKNDAGKEIGYVYQDGQFWIAVTYATQKKSMHKTHSAAELKLRNTL